MPTQTSLIAGASRGLGLAREHLRRGWNVAATVRGLARTPLHDLAERLAGRVEIDVVDPDQIGSLRLRLGNGASTFSFRAVTLSNTNQTIADVPTVDFANLMDTNALSPIRVVEAFGSLVRRTGTIAVMSSGLGSIGESRVYWETYSASKAALNMLMKCVSERRRWGFCKKLFVICLAARWDSCLVSRLSR